MAQTPTNYTPPSATTLTELWYSETEAGTGKTQVFGVQTIPSPVTAKEDITYRTMESDTEFAVKGVRPYETIEVECIFYKEQYTAVKTLADANKELWWFLKLPDSQETIYKWRGSVDISLGEIGLDGMIMSVLKIGKSSVPVTLEAMPT